MKEATISVNGHLLTEAQSMATRVAVTSFLMQLRNRAFAESLGQLGIRYNEDLTAVQAMINGEV